MASDVKQMSKYMVPAYLQQLVAEKLGNGTGVDLHGFAIIASTLRHLAHAEITEYLYSVYRTLGYPISGGKAQHEAPRRRARLPTGHRNRSLVRRPCAALLRQPRRFLKWGLSGPSAYGERAPLHKACRPSQHSPASPLAPRRSLCASPRLPRFPWARRHPLRSWRGARAYGPGSVVAERRGMAPEAPPNLEECQTEALVGGRMGDYCRGRPWTPRSMELALPTAWRPHVPATWASRRTCSRQEPPAYCVDRPHVFAMCSPRTGCGRESSSNQFF